MALKLKWPFEYKIIPVASDGKFGRNGSFDKQAGFPHQGSDYKIPCNVKWEWPLSGTIDLFEKHTFGYGYYVRIKATNGYYLGFAHNNEIAGYKGKKVKAGDYGGKVGNTGLGAGCHSHIELRNPQGLVIDPEKNIQWIKADAMADATQIFKNIFITIMARWPTAAEVSTFLKNPEKRPYTYVQKKYLPTRYVSKAA